MNREGKTDRTKHSAALMKRFLVLFRGRPLPAIRLAAAVCIFFPWGITAHAEQWDTFVDCALIPRWAGNDGDSFHVLANGKEYIFRLYFVDSPETSTEHPERVNAQAKFFGTTPGQVLATGEAAKHFTLGLLEKPFTVVTRWQDAKGSSSLPRYFAFVVLNDGSDLASLLLENGLARFYGAKASPPAKIKLEIANYARLQKRARDQKRGAWRGEGKNSQQDKTDEPSLADDTPATEDTPSPTPADDGIPIKVPGTLEITVTPNTDFGIPGVKPKPSPAQPVEQPPSAQLTPLPTSGKRKVNLNTATPKELDSLPGIGKILAERIIEGRPYGNIWDLEKVRGIDMDHVTKIQNLITAP